MNFDRMIVLDFETTGLQPGFRPVEIAWLEFDATLTEVDAVSSLLDPRIPIEPGAQRTHGITPAMVAGKPTLAEFLEGNHAGKFTDEHVLVVAHNARYDVPMFAQFCAKVTPLCTMELSQALLPDAPDHRLETMVSVLGIEIQPNHRASADVAACFEVLRRLAARETTDIAGLIAASHRFSLDSVMPFGKHKGTRLRDLPESYVQWCIENLDHDNKVRKALLDG